MMKQAYFAWAAASLVSALFPATVLAQPYPLDPAEFQLNTYAPGHQSAGGVARLADGDFVVVWTSDGSAGTDSSGYSVQARRFAASGESLGDEFQVNSYTTGRQGFPRVAAAPNGQFVVAWTSRGSWGNDDQGYSVQARRYGTDGVPLDAREFQVNTYTTGNLYAPGNQYLDDVAMDAQANFIVVWESDGSPGTDHDGFSVQARRFRAGGAPIDAQEFQVNTYTTSFQDDGAVAMDAEGNFVVAWQSYGSAGSDQFGYSAQARRFAADGTPLDPVETQLNTFTILDQRGPHPAMDPRGGFVVVWASDTTPGDDILGIQGRRFGPDGTPLDPVEFQVNEYTWLGQWGPTLAMNGAGDFVVSWSSVGSFGNDDSGSSVQLRRYRADSTPIDQVEQQVNTYTSGTQDGPRIAAGPDGDFVVVWSSDGSFGSDADLLSVQARRFGRPTIEVTSASGGVGGPGCTLRDAITAANANVPVGDCPAGNEGAVVELPVASSIALTEPDNGSNALPLIERPVTILGHGSRIERDPGLACPVGPEFRLFEVAGDGVLTLDDLSVSNGCLSSGAGGGVFTSGGTVVLRKASIQGNETGSDGGGVAVEAGNLLAFDSTVRGNLSAGSGGGVAVAGAPRWLLFDRVTISENAAASGGGLSLASATPAWIRNSTFSGNEATAGGGGIDLEGGSASLTLDFSTVAGNASPLGAGVLAGSGVLSLHGSLVGEGAGGADCASGAGSVVASGANLDTDGSCAALAGGNVTTVASLDLGPLADNGGWVRTHLPLAGSPALDAAPACATESGGLLVEDARGYSRPTDDDGNGTPACDLGAVERGTIFRDGFESGDLRRWSPGAPWSPAKLPKTR